MLMVIFGAGASYDALPDNRPPSQPQVFSAGDIDYRPPLANQLFQKRPYFDEMIERYRECVPVVRRLRWLPNNSNFEHELEVLRAEGTQDSRRYVQLAAIRFYLRSIMSFCGGAVIGQSKGVTNYSDLVDRLAYWCATHPGEELRFVTFNYDTLLEDACVKRALIPAFSTIDSYVSKNFSIYKPHGSVNWVRLVLHRDPLDGSNVEHSLIEQGDDLKFLDDRYVVQLWNPHTFVVQDNAYTYPAIALPVETKSTFECPANHLAMLKADILDVTRLLVVGWRATEEHFLELWRRGRVQALQKIAICAGTFQDTGAVRKQLEGAGLVGQYIQVTGGFSDLATSPELQQFLAD